MIAFEIIITVVLVHIIFPKQTATNHTIVTLPIFISNIRAEQCFFRLCGKSVFKKREIKFKDNGKVALIIFGKQNVWTSFKDNRK